MSEVKVDIKLLKELRETTGVSFSDCRFALVEANNDIQKALEVLKVRGLSKALSRSNNAATEGITKIAIKDNCAVIAELNCQTDFVANNTGFHTLLNDILTTVLASKTKVTTVDEVLALNDGKETLKDVLLHQISKLGENIVLRRISVIQKQDNEFFGTYTHTGGVRAGIVVLEGKQNDQVALDIAMQLVAMNPKFIDQTDIDPAVRSQELKIAQEQIKDINKPQAILDKMLEGKVNKALAELTIMNQSFIKEQAITVKQYLEQNNVKIKKIIRYEVGEN